MKLIYIGVLQTVQSHLNMRTREYDKAIEFYKKAYDNKESHYDDVWYSIANVYIKTGDTEQAVKYLKRILTVDKKK